MEDERCFTLSNGVKIPAVGFGTGIAKGYARLPLSRKVLRFLLDKRAAQIRRRRGEPNNYSFMHDLRKDKTLKSVAAEAARLGCRLYDTARAYSFSEEYLGDALLRSGLAKREELFIITKATNRAQANDAIRKDLETSLKNLGTDYIDLYLLHWPQAGTYLTQWKVMEAIYKEGIARSIGVCNCHVHHLEALRNICEIMPMANEIECHPHLPQWEVRKYCKERGIQMIAYTPLGRMRGENKAVKEIAAKKGAAPSQVILRWHYQMGDVSIPNTTSAAHLKDNLNVWGFSLSEEEMQMINSLENEAIGVRGGGAFVTTPTTATLQGSSGSSCESGRIWPNPDTCDFTRL